MDQPSVKHFKARRKAAGSPLAKLISLAFGILLFFIIEAAARLVFPQTHLDSVLSILQQDPVLYWRNRSNLNVAFAGAQVHTDRFGFRTGAQKKADLRIKRPETFRIVSLGASPTFGWGVEYVQTYPYRLERTFEQNGCNGVKAINAGMIGYSSHQGTLLLSETILDLKPDLITVSYVINDIDKYRFYLTNGKPDRLTQPQSPLTIALSNILLRFRMVTVMQQTWQTATNKRSSFQGRSIEVYKPQSVRVTPDNYRQNIIKIIDLAERRGIHVVLLVMPVNLPVGEQPFANAVQKTNDLVNQAVIHIDNNEYEKALDRLDRAVAIIPKHSLANYYRGICYKMRGREKEAKAAFDAVMNSEAYRCGRDGLHYNSVMRQIAKDRRVPFVDIAAAFSKVDHYLFVSPEHDPIHPNPEGHAIIAREAYPVIQSFVNHEPH